MTRQLNSNLHDAKRNKNDEFYTRLEDVSNELHHYRHHFKDKVVYCNCDDPYISAFFEYFSKNFEVLGLKKLITTCYKNQEVDLFSQHDTEQAIKLVYEGGAPQSMPTADDIGVTHLKGDGDFRSQECIDILKEADIVVTNPPFSLFREYVTQLDRYDKKFLILGNKNAVTYKEVFPLIKENRLWIGVTPMGVDLLFGVSDEHAQEMIKTKKEGSAYRIINDTVYARAQACWYTNLDHDKRHRPLDLYKRYTPDEYPHYDNYDAINVNRVVDIPEDWEGVMGVPITYLDKYCPEQFEILGATQRGCHDEVPDTKKYDDYWEVRQNGTKTGSKGGKTNENANIAMNDGRRNYFINTDGHIVQSAYQRIFIKHKNPLKI